MGLFDSLKKNLGNIDLGNIAKEAEKYKEDLQKNLGKFGVQQSTPAPEKKEPVEEEPVYYQPKKRAAEDQFPKFDDIISRNFPDYEVRRNLPASELMSDCHPACTPIQFMFYKDGAPVLAVVLVRENNYRGMNVLGTKKICDAKNIKYIRFYHEYENNETYVVNRIRDNL